MRPSWLARCWGSDCNYVHLTHINVIPGTFIIDSANFYVNLSEVPSSVFEAFFNFLVLWGNSFLETLSRPSSLQHWVRPTVLRTRSSQPDI
jgi:hypothetical protein